MFNRLIIFFCFALGVFLTRIILNSFNTPLKNLLSIFDCLIIIAFFAAFQVIKNRYFK